MNIIRNFLLNRVFLYLLFWTASYIFLVNTFQVSVNLQPIDYIYGGIFQFTLMIAVHINL